MQNNKTKNPWYFICSDYPLFGKMVTIRTFQKGQGISMGGGRGVCFHSIPHSKKIGLQIQKPL